MVVEVDGSYGEGGGQILRASIALSAVTGMPIKVRNIRVRRSPPGLRAQHRTAVEAMVKLTDAYVRGLELGSTELEFAPRQIKGGRLILDTGTAGSTTLVLQSLLPAMAFSETKTEVEVRGGTNNPLAPQVDYVQRVLVPILSMMGLKIKIDLIRRGFYPRGGGIVNASVSPTESIQPIELTRFDKIAPIEGIAYSSRLPKHITQRIVNSVKRVLEHADITVGDVEIEVENQGDPKCALSPGCGILLTGRVSPKGILGADSLGQLGKSAERVGEEAAHTLLRLIGWKSPVDPHLGDQLIIYMALAEGRSTIQVGELTPHIESCIYVCECFFGKIFSIVNPIGPVIITCDRAQSTKKY
ncbi:MAG: RNA 3'-terminal phosphate cyclase [Candidatus Bathyarchaeia archaeon]